MSRNGRCVWQAGVVIGAARASSRTRWSMVTDAATTHPLQVCCGAAMASAIVVAGDPYNEE
jgi:hypothetical protein